MRRRKFLKWSLCTFLLLTVIFFLFASARLRPLLLIKAAQTGNVSLARRALNYGVSPNIQTCGLEDDDVLNALAGTHVAGGIGCSVLTVAAYSRSTAVVELLLNAGADPNRGDGPTLPLMAAVASGNTECVRLLLQHGADPNCTDKDNTPILDEAPPGSEIATLLKRAGAKGSE